jgi:CO/xanthine dehydrogenase Mo-binding subunit
MARGLTVTEVAAESKIVKASRWGQVENGYVMKSGRPTPTSATDMLLAHMARAVGVSPEELRETGRGEAATILDRMGQQRDTPDPEEDHLDRLYAEWKADLAWRPVLRGFLESKPDQS